MQRNSQPLGCIIHGVGMHFLRVLSTFPVPFLQSRAALVRLGFALSARFPQKSQDRGGAAAAARRGGAAGAGGWHAGAACRHAERRAGWLVWQ